MSLFEVNVSKLLGLYRYQNYVDGFKREWRQNTGHTYAITFKQNLCLACSCSRNLHHSYHTPGTTTQTSIVHISHQAQLLKLPSLISHTRHNYSNFYRLYHTPGTTTQTSIGYITHQAQLLKLPLFISHTRHNYSNLHCSSHTKHDYSNLCSFKPVQVLTHFHLNNRTWLGKLHLGKYIETNKGCYKLKQNLFQSTISFYLV